MNMADAFYAIGKILSMWLLLTLLLSGISAWCYPWFRRSGRDGGAVSDALTLLLYGLLPPAVATLIVVLVFNPQLSGALIPSHCHGESCTLHSPELTGQSSAGLVIVSLLSLMVMVAGYLLQRRLRHARRQLKALAMLSRPRQDKRFALIDTPEPLAWCAGLLRPRIYLSQSLENRLDEQQLHAVLLHELAHSMRRDNLRRLCLQLATFTWPGQRRQRLLQAFNASTEKACDSIAAQQLQDTAPVIAALKELSRSDCSSNTVHPFSALEPGERIQALQAGNSNLPWARWLFLALLWILPIVLLTGAVHRLMEWLPI